jgi:hypothetical protein
LYTEYKGDLCLVIFSGRKEKRSFDDNAGAGRSDSRAQGGMLNSGSGDDFEQSDNPYCVWTIPVKRCGGRVGG